MAVICVVCGPSDGRVGAQIVDLLAAEKLRAAVAGLSATLTRQVAVWVIAREAMDNSAFVSGLRARLKARLSTIILIIDDAVAAGVFPAELTVSLAEASLNGTAPEARPLLNRCRMLTYAVPSPRALDLGDMAKMRPGAARRAAGRPSGRLGAPLPPTQAPHPELSAGSSDGQYFARYSRWMRDWDNDYASPVTSGRLRHIRWLAPIGAALVGGGLLYAFRNETFAAGAALWKLVVGAPPPPGAAQATGHTYVDASVFGPKTVPAGEEFLVQVFLHASEDEKRASALAREADPESARRGLTTLSVDIPHGTRVGIVLDIPGLTIEEPAQGLIWMGEPRACQFAVTVPFDLTKAIAGARVRLLVDDVPVGSLRFTIAITPAQNALPAAGQLASNALRYRHVFLSYASPDRAEVLKRAQALRAAGVSFFQDLLALEPGERWERRLYEEIDRSDLFLLFWSAHAAASPWVEREIAHALARADASGTETPDIMPIVLDRPPMTPPPSSLQHIHFGDRVHYAMDGR